LEPTCVEEQMDVLLDSPGRIALVSCHKKVIDLEDREILHRRTFPGGTLDGREAVKRSALDGSNLIGEPAAGMFRKTDFLRAGRYRPCPTYTIDLDLWARLLTLGALHVIPKPLYRFRISPGSMSATLRGTQVADFNAFVDTCAREGLIRLNGFERCLSRTNALVKGILRKFFFALHARS
jgi:hypothetical protein